MELNKIDIHVHDRPNCHTTTREPARLNSEYPVEYIVNHIEREINGETHPVDVHYHFEDRGDELVLVDNYELVGHDNGCTKNEQNGRIEHERVRRQLEKWVGNRWDRIIDQHGNTVAEIASDY